MFVEKQPTKIISSVGATCRNGLNTGSLYVAHTELVVFCLLYTTNIFTPTGLKNLPLSALPKGIKGI